jgi:hypothetical protein
MSIANHSALPFSASASCATAGALTRHRPLARAVEVAQDRGLLLGEADLVALGVEKELASQLAYMLDGIDWRNPVHTFRPERAG